MKRNDKEKEYEKIYGAIPKDEEGRVLYLLNQVKSGRALKGKIFEEMDRIQKLKWNSVRVTLYIVTKGTPRPRKGHYGNFYVAGAAENKHMFEKFFEEENLPEIHSACKIYLKSYLPIPSGMKISEKILAELGFIRPIIKPDFDNLIKAYVDMLQGTLLLDDAFVIEGTSKKYYSIKPRIEMTIWYQVGYDSKWNADKVQTMLRHKESA